MSTQHTHNQLKHNRIMKIYVILMTCLAGSIITMMLILFGIRGLNPAHYAVFAFLVITNMLVWTVWPKNHKVEPFASTKPMSKEDAETLNRLY